MNTFTAIWYHLYIYSI